MVTGGRDVQWKAVEKAEVWLFNREKSKTTEDKEAIPSEGRRIFITKNQSTLIDGEQGTKTGKTDVKGETIWRERSKMGN